MRPLPESADVVIVGGGIMGLATAYELAIRSKKRIVVLDQTYLCGGASGRNGGGVRAQWSSEENIRLMKDSIAICRDFATKMRINVWFRQGGYLFLARSEQRAKELAASVELQRAHDVPSRMIDAAEAKRIVPELDETRIVAASYNPDDGVVFPWPFVWGYARAAEENGVDVHTFTTVTGLETRGRAISGVVTDRGVVRTELVLNATGAWSPTIARMVGVELPNHPHRHEICSTEPLKPFLRPLVADLASGLYFSQSMRGEIVGGISNAKVPEGLDQGSSLRFLGLYARSLSRTMPILGGVRVLRQWAGAYDITPDGAPIVGPVDDVDGFWQLCGFMGHGFMMAPIMAKLVAERLLGSDVERELFAKWNLRRYREGKLLSETMILG
jgi:sarcosine oxidase subunit beta